MSAHVDDWMTVNEVAQRTGRTRQWVHHRLQDGTFRHERAGRRIDVEGGSVYVWMLSDMAKLLQRIEHLNLNLPYK